MKKLFLFIVLICLFGTESKASHAAGGELWYEYISGNTYKIYARFYRDCSGIPAPTSLNLCYSAASIAAPPTTVSLTLDTVYTIDDCMPNSCTGPAFTYPGYESAEYSQTIVLSGNAVDWKFWYSVGARNPSTNLSSGNLYIETTLDNLTTPFNNSAFPYLPINLSYSGGNLITTNFPALDIDGDSLDIFFTQPQTASNTCNNLGSSNLTFTSSATNYTTNNPFASSPAPVLNPTSGNLTFGFSIAGQFYFAIRVNEYRNGLLIATSIRDYLFKSFYNSQNGMPELSGVNNTPNYYTSINVCPSANLTFTVNSSDPNPLDSTTISYSNIPMGSNFSTNNAQNQTGTFSWAPTQADVRSQPYVLGFKVKDNNCGTQSYGYLVYVNQCSTDSVWAGDANADFTCDNYDVLNIGIANGSTGVTRPLATTNWQAEWCAPWTNSFLSTINYKHADCNGDGTVNSTDLASVTLNYGQIHFKNNNIGQYKTAGLPDLFCNTNGLQAERGATVSIPIMLGTTGSVMNDFYGIAGTVELLNAQTSAPISITNNNSWIGDATNSFAFEKSLASNKSAFTLVRNDQQNVAVGQGQIGTIEFPIDANSVLGSKVVIQFSDLRLIDKGGNEIVDYNVLSDTLTIVAPTSVNDFSNDVLALYPNPTKNYLNIPMDSKTMGETEMAIYQIDGRLVNQAKYSSQMIGKELRIDVKSLSKGIYIIKFENDSNIKLQTKFSKY